MSGVSCMSAPTVQSMTRGGTRKKLFMAGGISNCPLWQADLVRLLALEEMTLLNPRRENFPMDDPSAAEEQIGWEHHYLNVADGIAFWFPCETLCPIALYELGKWTVVHDKPIFIGVHPDYKRRVDVEIQTSLERPSLRIVYSLEDLAKQIKYWNKYG